jgi:hypothetical protein
MVDCPSGSDLDPLARHRCRCFCLSRYGCESLADLSRHCGSIANPRHRPAKGTVADCCTGTATPVGMQTSDRIWRRSEKRVPVRAGPHPARRAGGQGHVAHCRGERCGAEAIFVQAASGLTGCASLTPFRAARAARLPHRADRSATQRRRAGAANGRGWCRTRADLYSAMQAMAERGQCGFSQTFA